MHDLRVYYQRNISKEEQEALEYLRGYDDIVINKRSAVVVMDREKYVVPLKKDPAADMINKINARINTLHGDGYISDSTLQYLLINSDARARRFYLLSKIHKTNCPGRPVRSGCNTPTEKVSAFVDYQLKPLVPQISSYVKNTNDFVRKLKDMGRLPEGAILVTIDVVGLYPHIPH